MTHRLFFSSCFKDPWPERLKIRERVKTLNDEAKKLIWFAEDFPELKEGNDVPLFEKALFCVEGVRKSEIYVAVVRQHYGSGVNLTPTERVQVSYFELELFEAALLQKPAFVFLLEGAELDPRIASLLRLLSPALPGLCWTPLSEDEIFRRIEEILNRAEQGGGIARLRRAQASSWVMSGRLTGFRHREYDPRTETPALEFMGVLRDDAMERPTLAHVEQVLAKVDEEQHYQRRLVLLWSALRELMGASPGHADTQAYLPFWERALSGWNSAGAWYGLHGHPLMGCLSSLSTLVRIRTLMGKPERPHGAMSSEYYSISKKLRDGGSKRSVLNMSRRHIDAACEEGETAGKLAVRGSVRQAMGDRAGAIEDYERVVFLRENIEFATEHERGDGLTELGFALVLARQSRGIDLMERGIDLLERSGPSGFLIRAKRKLGRAYLISGSVRRAVSTLAEAHDLAASTGALDQLSQIDRLAKAVDSRLHGFRPA